MGAEVVKDATGREGGVGGRQVVGEVGEDRAAFDVADVVEVTREPSGGHLGPVGRDVVEGLGIHLEALQGGIGSLDGAQVVLPFAAAPTGADQAVGAEDPGDGAFRGRQTEEVLQPAGAEARDALADGEDLPFHLRGDLVRTPMRGAGLRSERRPTPALKPPQPQPNRVARAAHVPGRHPNPVRSGMEHHGQTRRIGMVGGADHRVV
jgi:hypothetical protein